MASNETRERLLEAACEVFAAKGYEAATVREICERAQANGAAVNYHFGHKQRLYYAAIKRAHRLRQVSGTREAVDGEQAPATQLRVFVRGLLGGMLAEGTEHHRQLLLQELARPTDAIEELAREVIRGDFEQLLGILARLLPSGTPPERLHLLAFSVVGQCLHYKIAMPVVRQLVEAEELAGYTVDRLAEHIAQVALAAVGAEPPVPLRSLDSPAATPAGERP